MDKLPLDGFTGEARRVIYAFERLRFRPSDEPVSRRVAVELGYKLDGKRRSSYVLKVIRQYRKSLRRS